MAANTGMESDHVFLNIWNLGTLVAQLEVNTFRTIEEMAAKFETYRSAHLPGHITYSFTVGKVGGK